MTSEPGALLAHYDRLEPKSDAMRDWLYALPLDDARTLAYHLGARMFRQAEEAQEAAREARRAGRK